MARARSSRPTFPAGPALAPGTAAPPLAHQALRALAEMFTGDLGKTSEDKECDALREMCRKGNPFPLIGYQWPELLVTDKAEQEIFKDNLKLVEPAAISDEIKHTIFLPRNPVLRLDWWQHIAIAAMFDLSIGEVFCAGATGVGKGAIASIGVNCWYDAFEECRIHLTGRDRDHARRNIFGETAKWATRMKYPGPGSLTSESLASSNRHYIQLLNPDVSSSTAGEAFSGQHAKQTYYVFDEASAHPNAFVDNARRNAHMIVALSNPRSLHGWFHDGFAKMPKGLRVAMFHGDMKMRLCMQIGGADAMNVRYERLKVPVAPRGGIAIRDGLHSVKK